MTISKAGALALVVIRNGKGAPLPDAFGCFIGPHQPIEVEEGVSWRDALADALARGNALEDALGSLGYEVEYHDGDVTELPDEVQTLTVNGEPWDFR